MVVRRVGCDAAAADYAREALSFPGLRLLARVDRETRPRDGVATVETRYLACSLGPGRVTPARLLGLVRGHREVENSLHDEKDRWWDEDRHVCRRPGLAAGFTTLLSAAPTALRATGCDAGGGRRPLLGRRPGHRPHHRPNLMTLLSAWTARTSTAPRIATIETRPPTFPDVGM